MASGDTPDDRILRPVVRRSWERAAAAGVDPTVGRAPQLLDQEAVELRFARHPLAAAVPVLRSLLADVGDHDHLAAIFDADGSLLWMEGRPGLMAQAGEAGIVVGTGWLEEHVGTNGVGTALAERHPVQIFSAEHFAAATHALTCTAAPVHDPLSGELLGVIDVTGGVAGAHPHTLALVSFAARSVELELLRRIQREARAVMSRPAAHLQVLGRDRGVLRIGGRQLELSRRHTELLLMLVLRPEGLSAEQLALEVYGEGGRPGTVRTEMHRLRVQLGGIMGERPYRLLHTVECDANVIEAQIRGGAIGAAIGQYGGPAVPQTQVPRLMELRDRIDDALRAAVLAAGDSDLLERWLRTPSGRDDYEASRALIAKLDRADPRRAAERSRVRRLAPLRDRSSA
ncbi:MAG: GAF domain-containing protein [Solirubrobacteraceae bacterium]|nr:GAF domain-containing protein [Solirubrobacteraceae bacterium]